MGTKKWYESRLILTGVTSILGAVLDGLSNGFNWRQIAIASIGAIIMVLRVDTVKEIEK